MLNQNHSTVLATMEKINSIAAETMTKKNPNSHSYSWAEGRITYFSVLAKLSLMQPRMSLAFFPCKAALLAHDQIVLY